MKIGLIGNPNCGKTTLYNLVTGHRKQVGNWSGVTVEVEIAKAELLGVSFELADLPGIYSLQPDTPEQKTAYEYMISGQVDILINVIDISNLERGLCLTLQLLELDIPVVIALNMIEDIEQTGQKIDIDRLSQETGVSVFGISALNNKGVDRMFHEIINCEVRSSIAWGNPRRQGIGKGKKAEEYFYASKCLTDGVIASEKPGTIRRTGEKIDSIITNKYLGIPIFLGIIMIVFYLAFGLIGPLFSKWIGFLINDLLVGGLEMVLPSSGEYFWMTSLVLEGILTGVGSIITFMPQILLLFLFLSLLEDSGYMPRVAFMLDKVFKGFGLNGKSAIPLIMGFGCSVPAIMACRTIEDMGKKRITSMIVPFFSCGAKLPVYGLLCAQLIPQFAAIGVFSLYLFGMAVALFSAWLMNKIMKKESEEIFILEIPQLRMPHKKMIASKVCDRTKEFLKKAGTIILIASVTVWFLNSFDSSLVMTKSPSDSILGRLGGVISPVFTPLGFGNWQCSVSLLTGLSAKEAIVSTLNIVTGGADGLKSLLSPAASIAYLVFILLYTPCLSTVTVMAREVNSIKWMMFITLYQIAIAWIAAFVVYNIVILL